MCMYMLYDDCLGKYSASIKTNELSGGLSYHLQTIEVWLGQPTVYIYNHLSIISSCTSAILDD